MRVILGIIGALVLMGILGGLGEAFGSLPLMLLLILLAVAAGVAFVPILCKMFDELKLQEQAGTKERERKTEMAKDIRKKLREFLDDLKSEDDLKKLGISTGLCRQMFSTGRLPSVVYDDRLRHLINEISDKELYTTCDRIRAECERICTENERRRPAILMFHTADEAADEIRNTLEIYHDSMEKYL